MESAALLQVAFFVTFPPNLGPKLASHYKPVKKRSIVRRSIVRRTVRSMFGELTVRPIKNGLKPGKG